MKNHKQCSKLGYQILDKISEQLSDALILQIISRQIKFEVRYVLDVELLNTNNIELTDELDNDLMFELETL